MDQIADHRLSDPDHRLSGICLAFGQGITLTIAVVASPVLPFQERSDVSNMPKRIYEIRSRKDHRGVNLISDALPFGRLWYGEPNESPMQSTTRDSTAGHMMP